jgi:hypothetical protein
MVTAKAWMFAAWSAAEATQRSPRVTSTVPRTSKGVAGFQEFIFATIPDYPSSEAGFRILFHRDWVYCLPRKGFERMIEWPEALVNFVRWIKGLFDLIEGPTLFGVHLDLPFRFVLMTGLYVLISRKTKRGWALGSCVLILAMKELFDIFAVQSIHRAHWPDPYDLLDVACGFAGILVGEILVRMLEKRTSKRDPVGF